MRGRRPPLLVGENNPNSRPLLIDGVRYINQRAAADTLGVTRKTINNWAKKGRVKRTA